ncbi:MAG: hypothetical protein ACRCT8_08945, partial [Lacipirellulaceae bacterium]
SPEKPWRHGCRHPFCGEFFATLDRTAWSGWRPTAPVEKDDVLAAHRRHINKIAFRQSLKNALGSITGLWKRAA